MAVVDAFARFLGSLLSRDGAGAGKRPASAPGEASLKVKPLLLVDLSRKMDFSTVVFGDDAPFAAGLLAACLGADGKPVYCNRAGDGSEASIVSELMRASSHAPGLSGLFGRAAGAFACNQDSLADVLSHMHPDALVLLGVKDGQTDVVEKALAKSPKTTLIYNADDPAACAVAARVANDGVSFGFDTLESPAVAGGSLQAGLDGLEFCVEDGVLKTYQPSESRASSMLGVYAVIATRGLMDCESYQKILEAIVSHDDACERPSGVAAKVKAAVAYTKSDPSVKGTYKK